MVKLLEPPPPSAEQLTELSKLLAIGKNLQAGEQVMLKASDYPHIDFFGGVEAELNKSAPTRIMVCRVNGDVAGMIRMVCW
ncbi:MAG TPA: hypothetical protein VL306_02515 [Methylomirabilota bacterium]|nr:hypothetical protein [Methylomirabilota bacterium]